MGAFICFLSGGRLTYPSHEFNSLPVMYSFFWVERLRHEVLSDVENDFPNSQIIPHKPELITCSCLISCKLFVFVCQSINVGSIYLLISNENG